MTGLKSCRRYGPQDGKLLITAGTIFSIMKKLFVYLACSSILMLPLVSCSDDDPEVPDRNDPTIEVTLPTLSAHEFGSYSVRDKGMSIIAHNLTATANGKSYKPTEYYLTTSDGKRINLKEGAIVTDDPDNTVLLEGSCEDLSLGYNDVTLTAVYGDIKTSDNKASQSIRISVVSWQPCVPSNSTTCTGVRGQMCA